MELARQAWLKERVAQAKAIEGVDWTPPGVKLCHHCRLRPVVQGGLCSKSCELAKRIAIERRDAYEMEASGMTKEKWQAQEYAGSSYA